MGKVEAGLQNGFSLDGRIQAAPRVETSDRLPLQTYYKGLELALQSFRKKFTSHDLTQPIEFEDTTFPYSNEKITTSYTFGYDAEADDPFRTSIDTLYIESSIANKNQKSTTHINVIQVGKKIDVSLDEDQENTVATLFPSGYVKRTISRKPNQSPQILTDKQRMYAPERQTIAHSLLEKVWPDIQTAVLTHTGVTIDLNHLPAELPAA